MGAASSRQNFTHLTGFDPFHLPCGGQGVEALPLYQILDTLVDKLFSQRYNSDTGIPKTAGNPVEAVFGIGSVTGIMADQKTR